MDFMEKLTTSATMLLTGFTVVFGVLILLIFIIYLYGTIMYKIQNRDKSGKKNKKSQKAENAPEAKRQETPVAKAAPAAASNEIPEEIIAVISAAVDSMYGSRNGGVRIKSVKKSGGRSAWANAGVINNTRPF